MEDSLSNASYVPDYKQKKSYFGDLFRHTPVDQAEATPKNMKRTGHSQFSITVNTPQTSMNFQEKRPSLQAGFKGTDSVETIEKSERTVKAVKPYIAPKHIEQSPVITMPVQMQNHLHKRKSQPFTINAGKPPVQSPVRRELFSTPKPSLPLTMVSRVASVQKPVLKMIKREKTDTNKVIADIDAYKPLIEKAKRPRFEYAECIEFKKHRVNVQEKGLVKSKTKQLLANFSFEKKERVVGNFKERIGKNKKIIQYEAKALKSTNSQDVNNFRTQLKLIHLDGKNDYFFVEVSNINKIHKERLDNFQPPTFKSSSVFENFPLYSNCKIFFFMAINMRRLTATSEIYFYSKYKKNEPKMMSKHIEKLLMLPIYNLVKSADFLKPYRSPLAIQSFEFNKTYKSKSIFCGTSLYYTVMPNPNATVEQLRSSYSFKLRFYQDNQASMQEDEDSILKINGVVIKGCYDAEEADTEKAAPKAIFLDKNTLMNLLLQKFDYDNDSFNTIKRNRSKAVVHDKGYNAEEELRKEKSNYVLTKIDKMLEHLNLKSRQFSMVHFQVSNMTEYKDFFHRLVLVGYKSELFPNNKKGTEKPVLLDPLVPTPNNKFFRDIATSKSRETGSERNISTNKTGKVLRDQFKITVNNPINTSNQPTSNDSQTSNAATVPQRGGISLANKFINNKRAELKEASGKQEDSQTITPNLPNSKSGNKTQEKLKVFKKMEDDEALDKISHIPLNDKIEDPSPSMRSGMSIYEGEEDINSPKFKEKGNFLQIAENKRFTRSKSNHIDQFDVPEETKNQQKSKFSGKFFERYEFFDNSEVTRNGMEHFSTEAPRKYQQRDPVVFLLPRRLRVAQSRSICMTL